MSLSLLDAETQRLHENDVKLKYWKRWGPYLSERAWGTVREDYSADGDAWSYFPHEHARSRAYRWNEDGIAGICDRHQILCFAFAFWNGRDVILKERLFGLTGTEGNHGEDVKEYYFYLDNTPTHSYMKMLYKYPQAAYPYQELLDENQRRSHLEPEFELLDTGIFDEDRYFDIVVEYAKADVEDILIRIQVTNHGSESAPLHLLPTLWFRNTWSWKTGSASPRMSVASSRVKDATVVKASCVEYGERWLICQNKPSLLFTENETNRKTVFDCPNSTPYVKDGFHNYVIHEQASINPAQIGTKAAAHYQLLIEPGQTVTLQMRLTNNSSLLQSEPFGAAFDQCFQSRKTEADEFYKRIIPEKAGLDAGNIMRQAFAGLLWSKQFYHFIVKEWLDGDSGNPPPSEQRRSGRNHEWKHLYNSDVISMPDTWEYPWYAGWDLAFHTVSLALIDLEFAKEQLILILREWYMHPNGQLPAYEWNFSDVNPPVHAWAALAIYKIEKKKTGQGDTQFLERVFQKLIVNFTWWVNRKDSGDDNVFEGGFLGLDNISVFDRSKPLPNGGYLEQSDGTSWMAVYSLDMLAIAMELAGKDPVYEDMASKFFEHFVYISNAMNQIGPENISLWDEDDGFYYDVLSLPDAQDFSLKVRSMVGLVPLFAVELLESETLDKLPTFKKRLEWFVKERPDLVARYGTDDTGLVRQWLLSVASPERLKRVLKVLLDESEFLSPYGIRSLSKYHQSNPYTLMVEGCEQKVDYEPAESTTGLFGGNSNWRGPVWFPMNYLMIESLLTLDQYFGDDFQIECPSRSGHYMNLKQVATELANRLLKLFLQNGQNGRPIYGENKKFQSDPAWQNHLQFYEYFHGDNGMGLGASHQTGWTGLVVNIIEQLFT
jgi:hypothetical protein